LQKLPFDEIRQQLSTGEVSMVQLVEAYIKQIKATNQEINAVVFYDEQDAFAQAKRIQEKISQGTAGPLAGAIVGIKELICQEGVRQHVHLIS